MATRDHLPAADPGYLGLGIVANPFDLSYTMMDPETDPLGVQLEVRAAVTEALVAFHNGLSGDEGRPIWIERDPRVSHYYHICALSEFLQVLGDSAMNVLPLHISLSEMRMGRIRSALSALTYHVGGSRLGEILGTWMQEPLTRPDEELLAEHPGAAEAIREHLGELTGDPEAASEMLFGPCVLEREGTDLQEYSRESGMRQSMLDSDPTEDEAAPETDEGLAFTGWGPGEEPSKAAAETAGEEGEPEGETAPEWTGPVGDYVVAYARKHLSPVIARAIRAYRSDGTGAATEELKITKAPKKTLRALMRFARTRFDKILFVYDGFDVWPAAPQELKSAILGSLSEMRWAVDQDGLLAIVADPAEAPEVREQFATAATVKWSMPRIDEAFKARDELKPEVVGAWLESARVGDGPTSDDPSIQRLIQGAGGSLAAFKEAAEAAIEDAASRGAERLDEESVEAAAKSM